MILLALFRAKFACILAISKFVFRWEACKGSVWESMKKCLKLCSEVETRSWISWEACGLQAAKRCTRTEHARELNSHASWSTTGQKSSLAIQLARGLNSRLSQVARPSRQPVLFWKNWLFTFLTYPTINTLIPTKCGVAIQKEKP